MTGRNKPVLSTTIFSVGYEKRTIGELINLLRLHRVQSLIDVRLNPISRKKGFSKSSLSLALQDAGIEYRHERELGNPKDNREPFALGHQYARDRYVHHLTNGASAAYENVVTSAMSQPTVLLCYERDHFFCHRSCIIDKAVEEYGFSLYCIGS